jgi:hypothetical protein
MLESSFATSGQLGAREMENSFKNPETQSLSLKVEVSNAELFLSLLPESNQDV